MADLLNSILQFSPLTRFKGNIQDIHWFLMDGVGSMCKHKQWGIDRKRCVDKIWNRGEICIVS